MLPLLLALALQAPTTPPPAAHRPPALLAEAPPLPSDPLRGDWSKPSGKRVTLTSSMSVNDAIEHIADGAGWNVVLNTGTAGGRTLTLKLRDVAAEDALRAALTGAGLVATRTGNTVVVAEEGEATSAAAPVLSGFDRPTGRRFTGEFDGEDVDDALKQIASSAELSIVLPPGRISGSVTGSFKNVPVEDALRAVLAQGGLTAERQGELILVHRADLVEDELPPGMSRQAKRRAEQALRDAERALRHAGRPDQKVVPLGDQGRDRDATGTDVTILPGEEVRDANVVRGNLRLQTGSQVRDANAVLGKVTLDAGSRARDVSAVMGSASLAAGASAREVVAVLGNVDIGPGANVDQDVVSVGGHVHVDPTAHVGGSTHSVSFPSLPQLPKRVSLHLFPDVPTPIVMVFQTLLRFAVLFVLGLLVLTVFPRRMEAVSSAMTSGPWRSLFAGLLGSVAMPILAVLLAVTVIGILLIPVQVVLIMAGGVLGITALTYYLGRVLPLPPTRRTMVLELAAGTLVFAVVAEIPIVGAMVWVATWFLAFGAVLRTRFGQPPAILPTTPAAPPPAAAA